MPAELTPFQSGRSLAQRRIDRTADLQRYAYDRQAELVAHQLDNIDWVTARRIRNGGLLVELAKRQVEQTPEFARYAAAAIEDREMAASRLIRRLT